MAFLSPTLEVIKRQKVQPTEGEWTLLNFLLDNLDNTYEIYFQPFLNGDNPDFAIMRKESGVLLIEVKDWNLQHYYVDEKTKWRLLKDNTFIKSPLNQVENYKENLFKLHIEELFLKNIKNKNHWATVNCAVYFHNATEQQLTNFLLSDFQTDTVEKNYNYYRKFVSYFGLLGNNSLNKNRIDTLFTKFWLNRKSNYFDETLYNSFYRYLKAPIHQLEEGIKINYSKEQQELIRSEIRPRRKIKGVAGSGKTLVLAKRAVNAHIRTGSKVLILTFNLSLKNYIHDRISDVREEFYWSSFYITNYHHFFKTQANNFNLELHHLTAWQDTAFFEGVKDQIQKFDVVLIDEIQDYRQEWLDIIATYFMHDDTEWIVFGDDKQDIYQRKLVVRNIPGVWNKSLDNSFRFTGAIANIAIKFQKKFFDKIYELDDIETMSQIDFETRTIEYHSFKTFTIKKLFDTVYSVLEKNKIHSSDAGILCSKVEILREIDFLIRTVKNEKTVTTFESQEEFEAIKTDETKKLIEKGIVEDEIKFNINKAMHDKLEDIRKIKKNHFWMKTGTVKLSTVHSFKGWEIDTLFLFIEIEEVEFTNAELIYTGLTRARKNLIVFNLGNDKFDDFFKNEIENNFVEQ
jgi:hypothetical protein